MKRFRVHIAVAVGLLLLLVTLFIVISSHQQIAWPFKCSAFTRYNLNQDGQNLEFFLAQDLRFQNNDSGYLLLNGRAVDRGKTTVLNRTIYLKQGGRIDSDTFRYAISRIVPSPTDNTPDAVFNQLLAEFTSDSTRLQLDTIHIQDKAYLIGGPISYLFTCTAY
ncbi:MULTISPECIES: FidL-like protein [unclassified Brenneria]|uniref:FidL-like protein n=1 Tax=unclassified Brenneria TaxID=2634434 RepID=UPI0029C1968B|nr:MULTISPECIES: FidL-like protein [unclassified Brenneria]MDX5627746.1 FidL-like protein [Brenneria sp. L3-3Z]MDX5695163.1 FidL-like protein [Brenneria sp. L4-2C]